MKPGEASATALGAAMLRAAHLVVDGDPKILIDDYAQLFLDEARRNTLATAAVHRERHVMASRGHIVGRHALTEELLLRAVDRGCGQYVLLGAGYDSSALRHADALRDCAVFEVDHPDTQAVKREVLRHVAWPDNVCFAAVDFETDDLADRLATAGWRSDQPTFWSWMGVTMYLTDEAVFDTLTLVAGSAPGSTIAVGYTIDDRDCEPSDLQLRRRGAQGVASQGEPWVNFYRPAELARRVAGLGFSSVRNVLPDEFRARYFAGRADGLWFSSMTAVLVATV
jgi:methyltransferase (TIGR00027 family)